jgi:hypothetical protein
VKPKNRAAARSSRNSGSVPKPSLTGVALVAPRTEKAIGGERCAYAIECGSACIRGSDFSDECDPVVANGKDVGKRGDPGDACVVQPADDPIVEPKRTVLLARRRNASASRVRIAARIDSSIIAPIVA